MHAHFVDPSGMTLDALVHSAVASYENGQFTEISITLPLYGISHDSHTDVTDRQVTLSARMVFDEACKKLSLAERLNCRDCRVSFLNRVLQDETHICLRIMQALKTRNIHSSCESISFNNDSKNFELGFRVSSPTVTQHVAPFADCFFGPFDRMQEVCQREVGLSCAESTKPVLATWHLASCVAIAAFDYHNRVGLLFHVDDDSNLLDSLRGLKDHLSSTPPYHFTYLLLGGSSDNTLRRRIDHTIKQVACEQFSFVKRDIAPTTTFSNEEFYKDSQWSKSVRLARSVALDCTKSDPLGELMSYEPHINPSSKLHLRSNTREEAEEVMARLGRKMKRLDVLG